MDVAGDAFVRIRRSEITHIRQNLQRDFYWESNSKDFRAKLAGSTSQQVPPWSSIAVRTDKQDAQVQNDVYQIRIGGTACRPF